MRVQVDTGEVHGVAARLRAEAVAARRLASESRRLGGDLPDGDLSDAGLTAALQALGQVCADVLVAVAGDLDRLASATHAGATHYGDVEGALARTADEGRP